MDMSAPNIDFEKELPPWKFFPVQWLAKELHCSPEHLIHMIETGELPVAVDLRGKNSSRMMLRIPRQSLVHFLTARKDLEQVAAANPRPKYRVESKRRRKGKRR